MLLLIQFTQPLIAESNKQWKFDLGSSEVEKGYVVVTPETTYSDNLGYGMLCPNGELCSVEAKKGDRLMDDCITSEQPFFFQLNLEEGRYKVTVTLGSASKKSETTVKAESRRLMLENITTTEGQSVTKSFVVDVRRPEINDSLRIRLNKREFGSTNWDNNLCLEFNGSWPSVSSIVVEEVKDLPVIFLAGNSTVTDQAREPWASWGQMLPRFLSPKVVVANYAESGLTLKSFKYQNRLKKVISVMQPGDYLFMEFAHNDQKKGSCYVEPFTTYQDELRFFINEAKSKGGIPVLVTSTNRRKFDEKGKLVNTLGDYPDAMRQLSIEEGIRLIDLNAMSKTLYEALGVEGSKKAFVHYPLNTFPGVNRELKDNTHFNAYRAYELAKCVVSKMICMNEFKNYIVDDFKPFNPANPDLVDNFYWPLTPAFDAEKPEGN
ncbi:rhamnogalacturonan acetylesterase [Plebeiibacterium marinum]|uniref:Rhamnogalacturonan acetylesterase n=1 Tax=Plebeiibacterium marinum TaxID=2992111 RepID=A0AAE3MFX6_9BACT|nr:rhamnogalacturonan acetylesterase [Plebeiobacterium marinum]MCW3807118.1 rhamnogalacturonan acetylesterase [Plebeiobacterium marinum]